MSILQRPQLKLPSMNLYRNGKLRCFEVYEDAVVGQKALDVIGVVIFHKFMWCAWKFDADIFGGSIYNLINTFCGMADEYVQKFEFEKLFSKETLLKVSLIIIWNSLIQHVGFLFFSIFN